MQTRFITKNSDNLIIFMTGWGCDDIQYSEMIKNSKNDVLICWDYSDLKFNHNANFKAYNEIYLLAYSAGVFVAGFIKDKLPTIKKSIALNGNPLMFDKHFGIKDEVLNIFRGLNLSNYLQFRRDYLVFSDEEFEYFNEHSSKRDFESCFKELDNLESLSKTNFEPYEFDIAILSDKDKIFNPDTQREYYNGKYIMLENEAHDLFFKLRTFEDILNVSKDTASKLV